MRLRRVSADEPGWTRRRAGRGFVYLDEAGDRLADEDAARARALVIPPAWEDVWICARANGHLQAVGTDAAGRPQCLYHPDWRARRDREKFDRALRLGRKLPRIRKQVEADLDLDEMTAERAAALAVRLIDLGYFRIGSDAYADEHGSFGLTTLCRRHVRASGDGLVFTFEGKSGVEHEIAIDDALCVAAIAALHRRRGGFAEVLAFKQERRWRRLTPGMVNDYVRDVSGLEVTAKDFRTWHATVLAAVALAERRATDEDATGPGHRRGSARARKRREVAAIKEVADYLGNTPAIARASYVDPRILELHEQDRTIRLATAGSDDVLARRNAAERAVLRLLAED